MKNIYQVLCWPKTRFEIDVNILNMIQPCRKLFGRCHYFAPSQIVTLCRFEETLINSAAQVSAGAAT